MLGFLGLLILGLLVSLGIIVAQLGDSDTISSQSSPSQQAPTSFFVSQ
ncbi:hypothetical protein SAMN02746009_00450 [Hymenobacter psychrotolerans DSM 18569]|uniref:Uncharacterized protein n=2 Tax=Hymenobacter psychrotolerans TaxID=344998 RepID=A0A1M6Q5E1_9BACT|nr:hypothetical protein SAMN02746009_00450 [Hymenobacter psychrotolerans DSM 18569]